MATKKTSKKTSRKGNICRVTNMNQVKKKHGANSRKFKELKRKCGKR